MHYHAIIGMWLFEVTSPFCALLTYGLLHSLFNKRNSVLDDNTKLTARSQNVVLTIISISCIGAIIECVSQGWELWVVPLIAIGVVACWGIHVTHYGDQRLRENFYLIFSMLVAFFHGIHYTSFFDLIVVSALLMVTAAVLRRKDFLLLLLLEFVCLLLWQIIMAKINSTIEFDALNISRIILHFMAEICIYASLSEVLNNFAKVEKSLEAMQKGEEAEHIGMEDFLVNISHELRTPVNVINGMSTLILKKEEREDVISIRDAGRRLSHQIEDIQDYSEIQRGDAVLEIDRYAITSLLNDLVSNFNSMIEKRNLEFVVDLDPNVPAMLKGDSKKIKKIITHLLDNGFKFTRKGGVNLKIFAIKKDYGVNLVMEVTDTGIGMTQKDMDKVSQGNYQSNKKRNRSTGGIGLGLSIVYGFARLMDGFVSIESTRKRGTIVRVSVMQEVLDPTPCLLVRAKKLLGIAFHVYPDKYEIAQIRNFYTTMATDFAMALRLNLYAAPTFGELKKLVDSGNITHVFMAEEEYSSEPLYFDELAEKGITVTVCARHDFAVNKGSKVIMMPKPLYGYPCAKILNGETENLELLAGEEKKNFSLEGVKALIVDDEPMNLVVASGLMKEYRMIIDTADSGKEALHKYEEEDFDVIFMDHMMPEMDGIEAMRKMRFIAEQKGRKFRIVALTANAISGAREMFLREGFDGFISKPINISDFERVMGRVMSDLRPGRDGGDR